VDAPWRNDLWVADAHRGDGKRFVVRADEKLTASVELESAILRLRRIGLTDRRDFFKNSALNGSELNHANRKIQLVSRILQSYHHCD
jgi:hypothetical protein